LRSEDATKTRILLRAILPVALLLASVANMLGQARGGAPGFRAYPAEFTFHGRNATPKFATAANSWPDGDPRFRESIASQIAIGPNFAGAFTVAQTTCGTGCSYAVIVDNRTGRIFEDLPFKMLVISPQSSHRGLLFRRSSRLLVVEGAVDEKRPTRSYYEWSDGHLHLIFSKNIAP
jgi:hypothetical protein